MDAAHVDRAPRSRFGVSRTLARGLQLTAIVRLLVPIAVLAASVAAAHADPPRPQLWRALRTDLLVSSDRPRPLARVPVASHGLDDDLAALVARASHFAGKLCGLRRGIAAFVHVENLTGDHRADAPPRVFVFGLAFGAKK